MKRKKKKDKRGRYYSTEQFMTERTYPEQNKDLQFIPFDVASIWSTVDFALQEDLNIYLKKLDDALVSVGNNVNIILTGRSPIWLYLAVVARIIQTKPDVRIFYTKPTRKGNRQVKIYPR